MQNLAIQKNNTKYSSSEFSSALGYRRKDIYDGHTEKTQNDELCSSRPL